MKGFKTSNSHLRRELTRATMATRVKSIDVDRMLNFRIYHFWQQYIIIFLSRHNMRTSKVGIYFQPHLNIAQGVSLVAKRQMRPVFRHISSPLASPRSSSSTVRTYSTSFLILGSPCSRHYAFQS